MSRTQLCALLLFSSVLAASAQIDLNDDGIKWFEWFLNESDKTGTLIEIFENSNVWEELGNKILGSPINIRFMELFNVEKLTVLGDINESFKSKIQAMKPVIKSYVGGIR